MRPSLTVLLLLITAAPAAARPVPWLWDEAVQPAWSQRQVVVLQRHILLSGDAVRIRPRMRQPLLAAGTLVTPLLHVEVSTVNPPRDIEASRAIIVGAMRDLAPLATSGSVQLDMEAKPSQRDFYRSLVAQIRAALPARLRFDVTALAWWCRSPAWLDNLAADQVIPMFFRMGKDGPAMRAIVEHQPQQLHPSCRGAAAGFSPQEPFPAQVTQRYRTSYWFDRHAWRRAGPDTPDQEIP